MRTTVRSHLQFYALCLQHQPSQARSSSSFADLRSEMMSRQFPLVYDYLTPVNNHLLRLTLADFVPPRPKPISSKLPCSISFSPGRHLVHFPPPTPLSSLLPDGTDPGQSPGDPYVRRMWAGGKLQVRNSIGHRFAGFRAVCLERITDVSVKGPLGDEKVFVTIERRIAPQGPQLRATNAGSKHASVPTDELRERLLRDQDCLVIEDRHLVFLQAKSGMVSVDATKRPAKILRPSHEPAFSHTLVPSAALLFRFSALTFNAHRIHLERQYCLESEGHRNLLVHGPLSLVFMSEIFKHYLGQEVPGKMIAEIEYRNLAPLYADEAMKVCVRPNGDDKWDVWVEGRDGGYAVKGVARTTDMPASNRHFQRKGSPSGATAQ